MARERVNQPIQLHPIKEWGEKDGKKLLKSTRLYIGGIHVATVEPSKVEPDKYLCDKMVDCIQVESGAQYLEDIKMQIELSLKEFIARVMKPRKLKPVTEPTPTS